MGWAGRHGVVALALLAVAFPGSCGFVEDSRAPDGPVEQVQGERRAPASEAGLHSDTTTSASSAAPAPTAIDGPASEKGTPTTPAPPQEVGEQSVGEQSVQGPVGEATPDFCESARSMIELGDPVFALALDDDSQRADELTRNYLLTVERFLATTPPELSGLMAPFRDVYLRAKLPIGAESTPAQRVRALREMRDGLDPVQLSDAATVISSWCDGWSDPVPIEFD